MKSLISVLYISLLLVFFSSCKKCNNENPSARVVNNGTAEASLQITASDGDVVAISDLGKGVISSEKSYASGSTTIVGTIENQQLNETVEMIECTAYDITITSENKIMVFSTKKE